MPGGRKVATTRRHMTQRGQLEHNRRSLSLVDRSTTTSSQPTTLLRTVAPLRILSSGGIPLVLLRHRLQAPTPTTSCSISRQPGTRELDRRASQDGGDPLTGCPKLCLRACVVPLSSARAARLGARRHPPRSLAHDTDEPRLGRRRGRHHPRRRRVLKPATRRCHRPSNEASRNRKLLRRCFS